MPPRAPRNRNWCFTLHNPTEEHTRLYRELTSIISSEAGHPQVRFLVYQLETTATERPHFQGYIEFKNPLTLRTVKQQLFSNEVHCEIRRGTTDEAIAYCTKEESRIEGPWQGGTPAPTGGARTDILAVKRMLDDGCTEQEISDQHFGTWLRYHKAFERYRSIINPKRDFKTNVTVIIGPPGTGKSRYCLEASPDGYWKQRSSWWDCYHGENVIIDDYYGWLPYDVLLRICDRYPLLVETKGSQVNFTAKEIYITSNLLPEKWYRHTIVLEAFTRRVDKWIYMGRNNIRFETTEYEAFAAFVHSQDTPAIVATAVLAN